MATATVPCARPEWTRRFAYRAMLVRPGLDTLSAVMVAEAAFDAANDLDPEDAAEITTFDPCSIEPRDPAVI